MSSIKSFIYLDEYKMYSISSQIFEGFTEFIVDYSSEGKQEKEEQKGKLGSGRILGDIISKETGTEQKRFLHDYSYTLFERKLSADNKVLVIDADNIKEKINEISDCDFIKVSGEATFNDMKLIIQTISNFNKVGEALTYLTSFETLSEEKAVLEEQVKKIKNRNQRAVANQKVKNAINIERLAKDRGLNFDQQFLEKLAFLLEYGYKDQFELQIPIKLENEETDESIIFSAVLKRDFLKDKEDILIKRYARNSEKKFALFGMVTQSERDVSIPDENASVSVDDESATENLHLKQALKAMHVELSNIEDNYIGRLPNEVIIDPIAIYREL